MPLRIGIALREHRWFLNILGLAVLLRVATIVAYRPALMQIPDPWGYLQLSFEHDVSRHFIVAPDRPFGYPLALWLIARPAGFHSSLVTGLQHVAGLVTGTLTYVVLLRLNVRRVLAVPAAALVLLDTYAIALEQTILPEAFFASFLVAAAVLAVLGRSSPWFLLGSGLLLGAASSLRLAGLAALPAWGLFVVWRYWRRPDLVAVALLAISVPLCLYAATHAGATGRLGFTDASGFFLYGRVAYIADCDRMEVSGARRLCQPESARVNDPGFYIWDQRSPARRMFPGWGATPAEQRAADQFVGDFAREAIRARPLAYLGLVLRDFAYFFTPGASPWGPEGSVRLPARVERDPGPLGNSVWSSFENEARWPAPVLNSLWRVLHTPRWLLGPLTLLALLSVSLSLLRTARGRLPGAARRKETLLFIGIPVGTLAVAAATAQFGLRYLVAVAPMIVVAGALAAEDLLEHRGRLAPHRPTAREPEDPLPAIRRRGGHDRPESQTLKP